MQSLDLSRVAVDGLYLALMISAPVLVASFLVGLVVAVLQAATQIQDTTLTFVPKLLVVAAVVALVGDWMGGELARFAVELWHWIPRAAA
ncbi:MAG: flagellar biosynthesis protein FliQ [Proteobacteria bacterium]|nr:flagellar biosynthesis protein FliQ [Pseudomonadota bacterium]